MHRPVFARIGGLDHVLDGWQQVSDQFCLAYLIIRAGGHRRRPVDGGISRPRAMMPNSVQHGLPRPRRRRSTHSAYVRDRCNTRDRSCVSGLSRPLRDIFLGVFDSCTLLWHKAERLSMRHYPTFKTKPPPFLGAAVSSTGERLLFDKNQTVFDRCAHEPGQVVHIQLGHQVGPVFFDGFRAHL